MSLFKFLPWGNYNSTHCKHQSGQTLVEVALILALICVVTIGAVTGTGTSVDGLLDTITGVLGGEIVPEPPGGGDTPGGSSGVLDGEIVPEAPGGGDTPGGSSGGDVGGRGEAGALSMPAGITQGSLINLADDGTITAATTIGANTYRVLSMDGSTAKLLKMQSIGDTAFNSSSVKTTFSNGQTGQKYEGSTLDSKMTTFYNNLPEAVQNAIVEKNVTQKVYKRNGKGEGGTQVASATTSGGSAYQIFELGSVAVGNRKVWAPGVEDVIDYLGDSWTSADLMTMFYDSPSTGSKYVWLRSASSGYSDTAFNVDGDRGDLDDYYYSSSCEARPAFTINISH